MFKTFFICLWAELNNNLQEDKILVLELYDSICAEWVKFNSWFDKCDASDPKWAVFITIMMMIMLCTFALLGSKL
jgi:hypothetical protein